MSKKKSRSHIGYALALPFREGIYTEEEAYYDPWDGVKKAYRMEWFIQKVGQPWGVPEPKLMSLLERFHNIFHEGVQDADFRLQYRVTKLLQRPQSIGPLEGIRLKEQAKSIDTLSMSAVALSHQINMPITVRCRFFNLIGQAN